MRSARIKSLNIMPELYRLTRLGLLSSKDASEIMKRYMADGNANSLIAAIDRGTITTEDSAWLKTDVLAKVREETNR